MLVISFSRLLSLSLAAAPLFFTHISSAFLLSRNDIVYDTGSTVIVSDGLEWLRWDQTDGMSVNEALSAYGAEGWQLASNRQMSNLLNRFDLGFTFGADENDVYGGSTEITFGPEVNILSGGSGPYESDRLFVTMFGETFDEFIYDDPSDQLFQASAIFGDDQDEDGLYPHVQVSDDWKFGKSQVGGWSRWLNDYSLYTADHSNRSTAVALVREIDVPEPSSSLLALLAFAFVLYFRGFGR